MTDSTQGSESCAELAKALCAAQAVMRNPPKDSVNPHFKSKYADLSTVRDAVIPVLNKHGLSVVQLPCEVEGGPALRTVLLHESGEWLGTVQLLRPQQMTPQGVGAALTYGRRYALQSIAGVAAEDDDDGHTAGHAAGPKPQGQQQKPAATKQQPELGAGNTGADLSKLLGEVADVRKVKPLELWAKLLAMYGWHPVERYDMLKPEQLQRACDDLRASLAASKKA